MDCYHLANGDSRFLGCKGGAADKTAAWARSHAIGLILLMLGLCALAAGCSDQGSYKPVDFSKTGAAKSAAVPPEDGPILRVAVAAMISPQETFSRYQALISHLGKKTERQIQLVQRKTYGEVNRMFLDGQLDLAFVCSGPFAAGRERFGFEALATPIVRGEPFYQAYLIVHRESRLSSIEDLKGKVFAFTDPDSNTGAMVPRYWLARMGEQPESFFSKIVYTHSHDNSIMAVARKLVDGASVDGHVWEYFNTRSPAHTEQTAVIAKSMAFGSPPVVGAKQLAAELKAKIRDTLLLMHMDEQGRRILDGLLIDRFAEPDPAWYLPVEALFTELQSYQAGRP